MSSAIAPPGRRTPCDQFDAKPVQIRQFLRASLNPQRSTELIDEMRAAISQP